MDALARSSGHAEAVMGFLPASERRRQEGNNPSQSETSQAGVRTSPLAFAFAPRPAASQRQ